MNVIIESASSDDAAAIAGVHASCLRGVYEGLIPVDVLAPPDVEPRARHWGMWLARSEASTVVARVGGTLTGFSALHPAKDGTAKKRTGEIAAIYVMPSHWRRGIGRLLCERALAEARTRGFAEVVLWVLESNERARCFYSSLGFHPDGETRIFLERSDTVLYDLRYRRSTSNVSHRTPTHEVKNP